MKVSVVLITYNHERYIARALESVLAQQAPFDFEIIVTEDCSTDRTREIVHDFQRRYPDRIRVMLSERNQCDNEVLLRAMREARGDYITLLDGDDYWTATDKLARQVAFLDAHPGYSICHHAVRIITDDGPTDQFITCARATSTLADLVAGNIIATASVMYRKAAVAEFPEWQYRMRIQDWAQHILYAMHGEIGYLPEPMAAYRMHTSGDWSQQTPQERIRHRIELYDEVRLHVGAELQPLIARRLAYFWEAMAYECRLVGDDSGSREAIRKGIALRKFAPGLLLSRFAPSLYDWARGLKRRAREARGRQVKAGGVTG